MSAQKLILDYVFEHEAKIPQHVYLTQPTGGGAARDYTWAQIMNEARRVAAHLKSMGLSPGDRIGMLSKNCAHFFIGELAIWLGGFTTVAIFPTEGEATIRFVMEHSEAKVLLVGKLDNYAAQAPGVPAGVKLISMPMGPKGVGESWDDIVAKTAPLEGKVQRAPTDLAMIIYTSGSTGQPKGVMHSFERITRAAEGMRDRIEFKAGDRALSYLPLAHVFERAYIECVSMLVGGGQIFFAESLDTFLADLKRARPTLFISVPRLWLKFQQGVFSKMPPARLEFLLKIPILGKRVGKKVLTGLGLDAVRLAGSGSAPIPGELISWYRRLGLRLLEGYAMTEDFAFSHLSSDEHNEPGYVGVPYKGVEVKLSEEGEVLIKSPGCMVGYYKRPDLDAESFTEDGFFRTGDKGERKPSGLLKITGRVKELFKTAKGKYVSPAPIENKLNEQPLIELSCVSGVGQPAAYALIILAESIRKQGLDAATKERVEKELAAWLADVNKGLSGYEQLQMFVIVNEPWTIENGLLTPTMKLKRAKIEASVADKLEGWYANKKPVIWA
ncbi:MAG: AMP-binding protein [Archangium sp.]|nr:AMP-binding protein [Archangium sp.]MDP3153413.1 AMP-binding protein [Archangium sp.]MDP3573429.1 AMP-binding protein [Archangium sp.]